MSFILIRIYSRQQLLNKNKILYFSGFFVKMSYEQVCQFIQEHPTLLATTALASITAAATLWMTSVPDKPIEFPISLDNQSFEIEVG